MDGYENDIHSSLKTGSEGADTDSDDDASISIKITRHPGDDIKR